MLMKVMQWQHFGNRKSVIQATAHQIKYFALRIPCIMVSLISEKNIMFLIIIDI